MGKRSKSSGIESDVQNVKVKSKKIKFSEEPVEEAMTSDCCEKELVKPSKKKNKKTVATDHELVGAPNSPDSEIASNIAVETKHKDKTLSKQDKGKNEKIIFNDDIPKEVNSGSSTKKSKKDTNLSQNDVEDDVDDEEIDKFCDELTDEDNVHYENWVKLIEEKMYSNKNKTKSA